MAFPQHLVICSSCKMWIEYKKSGIQCDFTTAVSDDFEYTCSKCLRFLDLEENFKDCRCNEWAVVPRPIVDDRPTVVLRRTQVIPVTSRPISLANRFNGLPSDHLVDIAEGGSGREEEVVRQGVIDQGEVVGEDEERRKLHVVDQDVEGSRGGVVVNRGDSVGSDFGRWSGEKSKGKVVLCGDSLVRYVDREFCAVDRSNRIRVCLPGARIQDVSSRISSIVSDEEEVVVQVGTNNLQSESLEVIRSRDRELLCRLASTRAKIFFCSLLPRFDSKVSELKIDDLNKFLQDLCFQFDFKYLDLFSSFRSRRDLFARDGLHLNNAGARLFGRLVNASVGPGNQDLN